MAVGILKGEERVKSRTIVSGVTVCKDFAQASHWSVADNNLDALTAVCESLNSIRLQFLTQASAVFPLPLYALDSPTTFFIYENIIYA